MHLNTGTIDIKDEFEFKMWIKMIASIHSKGGDISKPTEILWKSVQKEVNTDSVNKRSSRKSITGRI